MEFGDWILIIVLVMLILYARTHWPGPYSSVMSVVDTGAQAVFGMIENLFNKAPADGAAGVQDNITTGGG